MSNPYQLSHLDELEAESMFVLREVAAQFERPAILFSGGKDSIVVTHLAAKAFVPVRIPMPLVYIDTGHNSPETRALHEKLISNGFRNQQRYDSIQAALALNDLYTNI